MINTFKKLLLSQCRGECCIERIELVYGHDIQSVMTMIRCQDINDLAQGYVEEGEEGWDEDYLYQFNQRQVELNGVGSIECGEEGGYLILPKGHEFFDLTEGFTFHENGNTNDYPKGWTDEVEERFERLVEEVEMAD